MDLFSCPEQIVFVPGASTAGYQLNAVPSAKSCDCTLLLNGLPPGEAAVTPCPLMKLKPFCLRSLLTWEK